MFNIKFKVIEINELIFILKHCYHIITNPKIIRLYLICFKCSIASIYKLYYYYYSYLQYIII